MAKKKGGFFRKLGRSIKNGIKQANKMIKEGLSTAVYAPLIPFAGRMRRIVKAKGGKPEKRISKLVPQFYKTILVKNYDAPEYFVGDVLAIVKEIVSWFGKQKSRKAAGEALTPIERAAADQAERVEKAMKQEKKKDSEEINIEGKEGSPKGKKGNSNVIPIVAGLAVVALIATKK